MLECNYVPQSKPKWLRIDLGGEKTELVKVPVAMMHYIVLAGETDSCQAVTLILKWVESFVIL